MSGEAGKVRKTVLVLDDSSIVLEAVDIALERAGYRVVTASSIEELEGRLAVERPDAFVLDVQMPEIYGNDVGLVLKKVRDVKAPIVLFSSLPDDDLVGRASEAGLDAWISKSAGVDALVACVGKLLAPPASTH